MLKKVAIAASLVGFLAVSPANAELHGRLPATPNGTDYQAYYDDVTNLTWLKDSNLPWTGKTSSLGRSSGIRQHPRYRRNLGLASSEP